MTTDQDTHTAELRRAFPPRSLDAIAFAGMNRTWDSYGKHEAFDRDADQRTWEELGTSFVDEHGGALFFLDPDAFVAVLPAYLAALLHDETESEVAPFLFSQLTRERYPADFDARAALLTEAQRAAIANALADLAERDYWKRYREDIIGALASWELRREHV